MTAYESDNIFTKIIAKEIPSETVYEDDAYIAIMDIMPQSRGHCLVIPKAGSRNILDASDEVLQTALPVVSRLAKAVKTAFNADGIRVAQFNEAPAGQTVFHLHFHVIPVYGDNNLKDHASEKTNASDLSKNAEAIRAALSR